MELESVPPFPAETVLEGESENWDSVIHQGDFVVSVFAASPAVLDVNEPFPYDEFVLVPTELFAQALAGGPSEYYPPILTGVRGNYAGSFEVMHALA